MTPTETKQLFDAAMTCYQRHKRHRSYASDSRAKRQLAALLAACRDVRGSENVLSVFHDALEKLDERGSNFLRPKPRAPKPIPEPWPDAHGNVLGNPLLDPDRERGKRGMRVLKVRDPELAAYYERSATDPYAVEQARRDEERERAEQNELESKYSAAAHELNPWANPNASETQRVAFAKQHPKLRVAIYMREAKPVRSNVFGRDASVTIRGKVLTTDPQLWHIVQCAETHNAALLKQERDEARRQAEAARRKIAELEPIAARQQAPTHSIGSSAEERVKSPMPFR